MTVSPSPDSNDASHSRRRLLAAGVAAAGGLGVGALTFPTRARADSGSVSSINGKAGRVALTAADLAAVEAETVDQIAVVATPERFPGLDPSGAGDSAPALKAAIAACPDGGTVIVPAGTYRLASTLSNEGKSISLIGHEATLVRAHPTSSAVLLTGVYDDPIRVTSISPVSVELGGGQQPGVQLAMSSATGWSRGDVVKVFADDEIPEVRQDSSNKSRVGDFMVVDRTSGNSAILVGTPNGKFTSNIRAARLRDVPVRFEGFRVDTDANGVNAGWGGTTIVLSALMRPAVRDIHVRVSTATAILMRGCYAYDIENVQIDRAVDNPSAGQFGYGILDNSSAYGVVRNLHARRVRHAYSDDTPRIAANSSVVLYGATYGTRVIDSVCHGASAAAFDTHSCSEFVTFDNCIAVDSREGFSLRGRKHVVKSCAAVRCTTGAQVITESSGADASWGHRITDFHGDGLTGTGIRIIPRTSSSHSQYNRRETRDVLLRNITLRGSAMPFLQANNIVLDVDGFHATAREQVDDVANGAILSNSVVRARDWTIDLQNVTSGSSLRGFQSRQSGEMVADGIELRWRDGDAARVQGVAVGESSVTVTVRNVRLSEPLATPSVGFARGSTIDWTAKTQASRLITRRQDEVSNSETVRLIYRAGDPQIILLCTVTDGRTVPALVASAVPGQILYVVNSGESSATVTVRHGAAYLTSLRGGANRRMTPNSMMSLVWTGRIWQQLA